MTVAPFVIALAITVQTPVDLSGYDPECGIAVRQDGQLLSLTWPTGDGSQARLQLDTEAGQPLLGAMEVSSRSGKFQAVLEDQDVFFDVRIGERNLERRGGWTIFFDRVHQRPSRVFTSSLSKQDISVASRHQRATVTIGGLEAGTFAGKLKITLFRGSPLIHIQGVVSSKKNGQAILYDAGLAGRSQSPNRLVWLDTRGKYQDWKPGRSERTTFVPVKHRTVVAEEVGGSVALFPPPHRFFYPLDFSNNLRNVRFGPHEQREGKPFAFGLRHDPMGDRRFVPWFNAPPGTEQELGFFLLLSPNDAEKTIDSVKAFTRNDTFKPLDGHTTFTSHYHVEHTLDLLGRQDEESELDPQPLDSGKTYRVPAGLVEPDFVRVFKAMGVEVVHLAEFHNGRTPGLETQERLAQLELMHAECRRLSTEKFLLLPGEEPNVHFGGHWISFFPKPVYWVLNRRGETPFVEDHPKFDKVYHVGSADDVLELLKREKGLAWTAHPRIKGSTGYPDRYRHREFYKSDRFLGAAWKAMPADLSQPRLGKRVLDLFDDMATWGPRKYVLGEVDVFKVRPDHELYGHMNVNYLRLDELPKYENGWRPLLDALRGGRFFVTTGEVLLPHFSVKDKQSGETVHLAEGERPKLRLDLEWTFPLAYAEIISGDGSEVYRRRVDLSDTAAFGKRTLELNPELSGRKWVRVEVWDVATNGAFSQMVWLE